MDLKAICIFEIDSPKKEVKRMEPSLYGGDFDRYVKNLVDISRKGSGRLFTFEKETGVHSPIPKITAGEDFVSLCKIAARKLAACEENIPDSLLVQAVFQADKSYQYVICQAEQQVFFTNGDQVPVKGLPAKNGPFKACVVHFHEDAGIEKVVAFDTGASMAGYWWKNFLELKEVYTDQQNTITAFAALDSVFSRIKQSSPKDYAGLRSNTIWYFRANTYFKFEDYLRDLLGDYLPFNKRLDVDALVKIIKRLPGEKKFDEHFAILREEVKPDFT